MAIRKWYFASTLWYYHQRGFPGDFDSSHRAYEQIDPQLRGLCRMLHAAGLRTTPSCQGHFYEREHFESVWDQLQREEQQIQSTGLVVKDSNSGRELLFHAPTYALPWQGFGDFYAQIVAHQPEGYLGILVPRDRASLVCQLHNHPLRLPRASIRFDGDLSCVLGGSLFGVSVKSRDPDDCKSLWQIVSQYVESLLGDEKSLRRTWPALSNRMS